MGKTKVQRQYGIDSSSRGAIKSLAGDSCDVQNVLINDRLTRPIDVSISGGTISLSAAVTQTLKSDGVGGTTSSVKMGTIPVIGKFLTCIASTINVLTGAVTGAFSSPPTSQIVSANNWIWMGIEARDDNKYYVVWGVENAVKASATYPSFSYMPVLMIEIQADGTGGTWTNYLTPNESDIVIFSSQASTIGEYLFDILDPIGVPKPFFGSESYVPDRHLVCSGGTIGNALSGATARANDDTWRLFDLLWNSFSDAELPIVPPGRGVSSSADFGANKSLPIPDLRGRTLVGKDDMGGVAASRMTSGGNRIAGNTLGAVGGEQQHTLAEGEMPIHNHSVAATVNSISSEKVDVHNEQSGTDPIVSIRTGTVGNDTNVEVTRADSGGSFYGSGMYCTVPAHGHTVTVSQNDKGSGSAHDNVQPGIIVNYIVRYK